jgi:hypothetical protein
MFLLYSRDACIYYVAAMLHIVTFEASSFA